MTGLSGLNRCTPTDVLRVERTVRRLAQGFTRHLPLAHQPHVARARHVEEAGGLVHRGSVLLAGGGRETVVFWCYITGTRSDTDGEKGSCLRRGRFHRPWFGADVQTDDG